MIQKKKFRVNFFNRKKTVEIQGFSLLEAATKGQIGLIAKPKEKRVLGHVKAGGTQVRVKKFNP